MTDTRAPSHVSAGSGGRTGPFFGWYVVASGFLVMFVGFGVNYTFGAFFDPLKNEFNATKTSTAGLFSLTGLIYFFLGAVTGRLGDRFGPRRLVGLGGLLLGAGLLYAGRATTLWQVYLGYSAGVGLGIGCMYVPAVGAVQQWFVRRRGFATGIAVAGIGAGSLAGPPLATALIRAAGWRHTYTILGLASMVLVGIALLRMERSPAARGLAPDGAALAEGLPAAQRVTVVRHQGRVYSTRVFWLLWASGLFTSLALFIPFVHLVPYAKAEGISATGAAWILSMIGAGSFLGRLLLGSLADRMGRRRTLGGSYAFMALMLAWWLVSHSAWQLTLFAFWFGVGYGTFVALFPALTADYFGAARAGAILGLLYTSAGIGSFFGPIFAARVYDATGAYTIAIAAGIAVNLLAILCVVLIDEQTPAYTVVATAAAVD